MGIELHQASEASPFAVRWWFDSGVDRAVRTGGLGRADHKCVHLRMSCRLHRRLPGRSTGHERTVPWIRTPSRRLLQPIEEPTDIPHPSPFPMQSRTRRIPPAATSRIQNRLCSSSSDQERREARLRRSVPPRQRQSVTAQTSGTPPRCPITHNRDNDQPCSALLRRPSLTSTRRTAVRPELVRETVNNRTRSSSNGNPSSTSGLCVVSSI